MALGLWLAPWGLVLLWPAVSLAILSAGYLGGGPRVFGKAHGRLHPVGRLLLGPYLGPLALWRIKDRILDARDHQIAPGLRLGRLVTRAEARALIDGGVTAVLDMTCEHAETKPLLDGDYRNVQILDLTLPDLDTLHEAVSFVLPRMAQGCVYVHCAQGHGRSAIVAAACLLAGDDGLGVEEAIEVVRAVQPKAKLTPQVCDLLKRYRERLERPATRSHP